jgi:hypothetical protein
MYLTVGPVDKGSEHLGSGFVESNRYRVEVEGADGAWRVRIVDPAGVEVASRACRDEDEARTYASVVRQHIGWLSEPRFREYYRLPDPI